MFEYMSAGIPVIVSNFPLWKEIVEEAGSGTCVDPLDLEGIASAVQRIIENPAEAKRMGENGRRSVEKDTTGAWKRKSCWHSTKIYYHNHKDEMENQSCDYAYMCKIAIWCQDIQSRAEGIWSVGRSTTRLQSQFIIQWGLPGLFCNPPGQHHARLRNPLLSRGVPHFGHIGRSSISCARPARVFSTIFTAKYLANKKDDSIIAFSVTAFSTFEHNS
jgi:hypothetical protein